MGSHTIPAKGIGNSKIKYYTRDLDAAAGDVSYSGFGFQPSVLLIFASEGAGDSASWGMSAENGADIVVWIGYDGGRSRDEDALIFLYQAAGKYTDGKLLSYDVDGFTLTWSVTGAPTGSGLFHVLALK